MDTTNLSKFPLVLRQGFTEKKIDFPINTEWEYDKVFAYRMIFRDTDDFTPANRNDFQSNAELKKIRRGMSTDIAEYYGVSLFKDIKMFENKKLFPKPGRKLAAGYICDLVGPKLEGRDTHICWWLYDNIDLIICDFKLVTEDE